MNNLENILRKKIQVIVAKLQLLGCTLLSSADDSWVMELLFESGPHRCDLIEWILSKLGYNIKKVSGSLNSEEERLKILQSALSDLGLCQQNSYDVIKGTAAVKKQLEFWCQLVDIIWLQYLMTTDISLRSGTKSIYEALKEATSCINKLRENVNIQHYIQHLFNTDLQLLAPDVEREIKNMSSDPESSFFQNMSFENKLVSKIPSLEKLKEDAANNLFNPEELQKMLLTEVAPDQSLSDDNYDDKLNQLEEELREVSIDFKNTAEGSFNDAYNDLESLILHAKADEFTDVGPDENYVKVLKMTKDEN